MDPLFKQITKDTIDIFPTQEEKEEMVEVVPELRLLYIIAINRENYEEALQELYAKEELFKSYYSEYLFRLEQVRKFVVDTNNIILDIEMGTGNALETFKQAHRAIDVLKALEERDKMLIENLGRQALVDEKRYSNNIYTIFCIGIGFGDSRQDCDAEVEWSE